MQLGNRQQQRAIQLQHPQLLQQQQQQQLQQQQQFQQQQQPNYGSSNNPSQRTQVLSEEAGTLCKFEELKFEDGGVYCGGTIRGKAHGHGVCTGPGGEGQYSGSWEEGFEVSGSYLWPNGHVYHGMWQEGKMNGLGVIKRGKWTYQGEMAMGYMGKYGVKTHQDGTARYEGTWNQGVQCGFGVEVYSDNGTYVGQWLKGLRQGYGIRTSSVFQDAASSAAPGNLRRFSLSSARSEPELLVKDAAELAKPKTIIDFFPAVPTSHSDNFNHPPVVKRFPAVNRIGFFLKGDPYKPPDQKTEQKKYDEAMKLQEEEAEKPGSFEAFLAKLALTPNPADSLDPKSVPKNAIEIYSGEWKNDKRSGFGICERSDGLKYEGEWLDNCKNGSGITTFPDGRKEEGLYKKNVFQEPSKKLPQMLRQGKQKEMTHAAFTSANKAAQIASQKAEIAVSRAKTAVTKKEQACQVAERATLDSKTAQYQLAAHIQQRTERAQKFVKNDQIDEEEEGKLEKEALDRKSQNSFGKTTTDFTKYSSKQNLSKRHKETFHGSLLGFKDPLPEPRPLIDTVIYEEEESTDPTSRTLHNRLSNHKVTTQQNNSRSHLNTLRKPPNYQSNLSLYTPSQQHKQLPSHYNASNAPKSNQRLHSSPFNIQSVPDVRADGPVDKVLKERAKVICESLREESRRIIELRMKRRPCFARLLQHTLPHQSWLRRHYIFTFLFITTITAATYFFLETNQEWLEALIEKF